MNKVLRLVVALGLAAGVLVGPASMPATADNCVSGPTESDETLYVDLSAAKYRYRLGQVAKLTARVSRTPFDSDLPYAPVNEADVFVYLQKGKQFAYGAGVTDADGSVKISIRIKRAFGTGSVLAKGFAHTEPADTHCFVVQERGDVEIPDFLRIFA